MDWREEYKRRLISPEDAAKKVKSGDRVAIGGSTDQPKIMQEAIFARKDELRDVEIVISPMLTNSCWLQPDYDESFKVTIGGWSGPFGRSLLLENRGNGLIPNTYHGVFVKGAENIENSGHINMDVFVLKVSPPNDKGVVSLGAYRWMKKEIAKKSKIVIAEVDTNQQWFCGDDEMNISDIDFFVEYTDPISTLEGVRQATEDMQDEAMKNKIRTAAEDMLPYMRTMMIPMVIQFPEAFTGFLDDIAGEPPELARTIGDYVGTIIKDGDIIQLGQGTPAGFFVQMGTFDNKQNLGVHT